MSLRVEQSGAKQSQGFEIATLRYRSARNDNYSNGLDIIPSFPRSYALHRNASEEALPPNDYIEAEPQVMHSQAEPGNEERQNSVLLI